MKKWNSILLVAAVLMCILPGCGDKTPEAAPVDGQQSVTGTQGVAQEKVTIIGSWKYQGALDCVYTFAEDGSGIYRYSGVDMPFTYTDDGSAVSILYTGNTAPTVLPYTIDGEVLSIEDSFGTVVKYDRIPDAG